MKNSGDDGTIEIGRTWRAARVWVGALTLVIAAAGCGGGTEGSGGTSSGGTSSGGTNTGGSGAGGTAGAGGTSTGGQTTTTGTGGASSGFLCSKTPPQGAAMPAPLPAYSGGACPDLAAGENTLTSSGAPRQFLLVLPSDLSAGEEPPVLFLWHWLGGSAEDFVEKGQIQQAVDEQRFVAVVPRSKGDVQFQWPFSSADSDARLEEEYKFFDDMLACVAPAYKVNTSCVGSAGVSAGALFTDQLAAHRAEHIASFLSLSGGVGGLIRPWGNPEHKLPGLVLWGGPTDNCLGILKFDEVSQTLEDNLTSQGSFFIECVHNCGHSEPPLDPPAGGGSIYAPLWGFVFDHPYWLGPGESPYSGGLPADMPSWCGIGKGSATPRVGPCSGGGC